MSRGASPEGKWVTVPVRVRESLLVRIDGVRGERNRSEWMRRAAESALGMRKPDGELRPAGLTRAELESRAAVAAPVPVQADGPLSEPAEPAGRFSCCKHCTRGHGGHVDPCTQGCR
jgi:hypothetical protein